MRPCRWLDLDVTTLSETHAVLWPKNAPMAQRAQQRCLATLLDVQYGQVDRLTLVDGVPSWQVWAEAEALCDAGSYEAARSVRDGFDNM